MMTGRNAGIDLLRAWAVTLTVLMHTLWMIGLNVYRIDIDQLSIRETSSALQAIVVWAYHSQHGVYIFFVLSGFLIADIWLRRTPTSYLRFLGQRAMRLLPLLWVVIIAAHFLPALGTNARFDYPLSALLKNLFLLNWFLPDQKYFYLLVTWSLAWEWIFYLSFPILFFAARFLNARNAWRSSVLQRVLLWAAIAALSVGVLLLAHGWRDRGGTYVLIFSVGVTVAYLNVNHHDFLRRVADTVPWWIVISCGSIVTFIYAWYNPPNGLLQRNAYGRFTPHDLFAVCYLIPVGLLFIKASSTDWGNSAIVRFARWIGEISYSIYLWHLLILIALSAYLPKINAYVALRPTLSIPVFCTLVVLLTLGISALSYRLIEQPYFSRRKPAKAPTLSGS
jgi:exopolysaccharide production protein ExoZ